MKKQILLLSVLMFSVMAFGQKSEMKALEKALKSSDFDTAIKVANQAESLITNADQKTKAKFYYLKAKSMYRGGADGIDVIEVGAACTEPRPGACQGACPRRFGYSQASLRVWER